MTSKAPTSVQTVVPDGFVGKITLHRVVDGERVEVGLPEGAHVPLPPPARPKNRVASISHAGIAPSILRPSMRLGAGFETFPADDIVKRDTHGIDFNKPPTGENAATAQGLVDLQRRILHGDTKVEP